MATDISAFERKSCLPDDWLHGPWEYNDLRKLLLRGDYAKLTDIFTVHPNYVNMREEENDEPMWSKEWDRTRPLFYEVCGRADYIADSNGIPPQLTFLLSQTEFFCPVNLLYYPLYRNDLEGRFTNAAKVLIQHDPMWIHKPYPKFKTPLYFGCKIGDESFVRLLLAQPTICVNASGSAGYTPLHKAIDGKYINIVKILLERPDIDVNLKSKFGRTPLHVACYRSLKNIVELLLARSDIKTNIRDNSEKLPEDLSDDKEIIKLVSHFRKKFTTKGETAEPKESHCLEEESFPNLAEKDFTKAWSFYDIFHLLLKKDVGNLKKLFNIQPKLVNTCSGENQTLLHVLVSRGYPISLVQIAVELGVNSALRDVHGNTAFHYAAQREGHLIPLLLDKDSTTALNTLNNDWNTPLHMICSYNRIDLLLLVFQKANLKIDEINDDNHKAEQCGDENMEEKALLFSIYREKGIGPDPKEFNESMKQEPEEEAIKEKLEDEENKETDEENKRIGPVTKSVLDVILKKKNGRLGFTIPNLPNGIFVKNIVENGAAAGVLEEGDQLLEVNEVDFKTISYEDAMDKLKNHEEFSISLIRQTYASGEIFVPW